MQKLPCLTPNTRIYIASVLLAIVVILLYLTAASFGEKSAQILFKQQSKLNCVWFNSYRVNLGLILVRFLQLSMLHKHKFRL